MHVNIDLMNFIFVCETSFRVFNEEILPNVFALSGIISNLIEGCEISSLSITDQLSLYQKLSFYLPILDKSVDYLILNLDVLQDIFNGCTDMVTDNYLDEFKSINEKISEFINLFKSLAEVFRDLENGLLMRNLINNPLPDFVNEPI